MILRRASLLVVGLALAGSLTACTSDTSSTGGAAEGAGGAGAEAGVGAQVLPPVMVAPQADSATIAQGQTIVFPVVNPADWEATSDNPAVLPVQSGTQDGDALFNPGGTADGTGTATVTLTNTETGETRTVAVNVTEPGPVDPSAGVLLPQDQQPVDPLQVPSQPPAALAPAPEPGPTGANMLPETPSIPSGGPGE